MPSIHGRLNVTGRTVPRLFPAFVFISFSRVSFLTRCYIDCDLASKHGHAAVSTSDYECKHGYQGRWDNCVPLVGVKGVEHLPLEKRKCDNANGKKLSGQ